MKHLQNLLVTNEALSQKQFLELREWWKVNHPKSITPRNLVIPLCSHYIDFEIITVWL